MLGKILLVALVVGVCCGNFFEDGLKKLAPFRKNVQHFAMGIPKEVEGKLDSKLGSKAQELLGKLRSHLLMRGTPLASFRPEQLLLPFGLKPASKSNKKSGRPLTLKSFNVANCSATTAAKDKVIIHKLAITPDPLQLPGTITFAFNVEMLETINDWQIDLDLEIKEGGSFIHVPCIGQFGSCHYNVCDLLSTVQACPQDLVAHKIPCMCPYQKQSYVEPGITAEIDAEVFVAAEYKATVNMTSNGNKVGCYTATFTIED